MFEGKCMDGWEDMEIPRTAASYYLQRSGACIPGSEPQLDSFSPISAHGVNVSAGLSQGEPVRRKPGRPRKRAVQSNIGGNSAVSAFQPDSASPSSAHGAGLSQEELNAAARLSQGELNASVGVSQEEHNASAGVSQGDPVRRKPGRPRKRGPTGSAFQLDSLHHGVDASAGLSQGEPVRRRVGRPRKRGLFSASSPPPPPSQGEWLSGSTGLGLTPHVITIAVGEDITEKILSFSQQESTAVCVLSAYGTVSTVTLCRPSTSSGTVKYEGSFEILWLSGSYMLTDTDGSHSRTGGLSVCLCGHNGEVIYGGVGDMLVAATPVQVIVGSFLYSGSKTNLTVVTISDSSTDYESSVDSGEKSVPSTSIPPSKPNLLG